MSDVIDFEAVRHRVKLVRDSGSASLYENRDGVACPVCGDPFDEALATSARSRQVSSDGGVRLCVARGDDQLVLFTHAD
ncbi:MAG: flagella cluster protein [Halobacterium sp.]